MKRIYPYVGPNEIRDAVTGASERFQITTVSDVLHWAASNPSDANTATFVIDTDGELWIADRRSEHVACARTEPVLSAGEITFAFDGNIVSVDYLTNQSTGYCPEPQSFPAVSFALDRAGIPAPDDFAVQCVFRRCKCGQINIVKNDLLECVVCGADLPLYYNVKPQDGE